MRQSPKPKRNKDESGHDLLIFLLILLVSFACLFATAQLAISPVSAWQVPASMLSDLDPDKDLGSPVALRVEPVRSDIMTPPAWDLNTFLTPVERGATVAPAVVPAVVPAALLGTATPVKQQEPTLLPGATTSVPTLVQTSTPELPTSTPPATPTLLPTVALPTRTPTTLPTLAPPTLTSTARPTSTPQPPTQPPQPPPSKPPKEPKPKAPKPPKEPNPPRKP